MENPTLDFFTTYILPIILGLLGSTPGIGALFVIIARNKQEKRKLDADSANKEADTMAKMLDVARDAAENVLSKNSRIAELETAVDKLRGQVRCLEDDKDKQQDEIRKLQSDKQALEIENVKKSEEIRALKERVELLESTLRNNNITIPNGGNK